jgi:hypothetical protein
MLEVLESLKNPGFGPFVGFGSILAPSKNREASTCHTKREIVREEVVRCSFYLY